MRFELFDHGRAVLEFRAHDDVKSVAILKDGVTVGEVSASHVADCRAMWEEVLRARRLESLAGIVLQLKRALVADSVCTDHYNVTPAHRRHAFYRGLQGGLQGLTVPYLHPLELDEGLAAELALPPDCSPSYEAGYQYGEVIMRLLAAVQRQVDAPATKEGV